MKLFLVYLKKRLGYDTYDSFVVVAKNEEDAKNYHPNGGIISWDSHGYARTNGWTSFKDEVFVKRVGIADKSLVEGEIVLNSFNAG